MASFSVRRVSMEIDRTMRMIRMKRNGEEEVGVVVDCVGAYR